MNPRIGVRLVASELVAGCMAIAALGAIVRPESTAAAPEEVPMTRQQRRAIARKAEKLKR